MPPIVLGFALLSLLVAGVLLGLLHRSVQTGSSVDKVLPPGSGPDALAVSSVAKDTGAAPDKPPAGSATGNQAAPTNLLHLPQPRAEQQQAAAQQAQLDEKKRELEQQAADQAAREQKLEQDRLRVEAEKQQAEAAAAEAQRQSAEAAAQAEQMRQAAANPPRPAAYTGPSSGNIVWQGQVQGTSLVTIDGNSSDTGQVVSGALPGVLVMIQPADAKHVVIAGAPAPSNSYRRLTLRIQGKGSMQEVIHWSVP